MTSLISGLSAQVISLSQQVAKLSAKTPEAPLTDLLFYEHPSDLQSPCSWGTTAPSCQTNPETITPEKAGRPGAAPPTAQVPGPTNQTSYATVAVAGPEADKSFTVVTKKKKP